MNIPRTHPGKLFIYNKSAQVFKVHTVSDTL